MKVLQINSVCGIGSTGRIATDIHQMLVKQGHESIIAYGREPAKNCDQSIKIGTKKDFYLHVIKTRILDKHGYGSKSITEEFINRIKEYKPDVIHLHNIHGYYLNIEVLFSYLKSTNIPVVWTLHDCWPFTGHCAYFDYAECNRWKSGCYDCPEKKSYPKSLLMDNSKSNYQNKKELFRGVKNLTIVTPSQWLAELVSQSYLSEYKVKVINNGIDLSTFKPESGDVKSKLGLDNMFILLGVASEWDRRKGLKFFIELSNKIDDDMKIILVGLTESQIKDLPSNIIGIARTNNVEELVELYSSADVFVNPTLEDNFPTTNLEALACGTPVITFKTGGSPESVDSSVGIVVEKGNTDMLLQAVSEIRKNAKSRYRDNALQKAQLQYNKDDKFSEYISLYEELL